MLKRAYLLEQGWTNGKLILACCAVETGEYHCVLIVETDKGQFILDNNLKDPVSLNFQAVSYKYLWNIIERGGKWYEFSVS